VILGGLALFVFGSAVAALAESVAMIAVGRALQGAGAISASVMALAADLTAEEQRTKAMAVIGISIGLSFALALVCGPLLAAWGGLAAVFWMTAALGLIGMAIVAFGVPTAGHARARGHRCQRRHVRPGAARSGPAAPERLRLPAALHAYGLLSRGAGGD
jgi:predicted MFS family arabinose efflux permease